MRKRFSIWKLLKLPPQFLYAIGLGPVYGRIVLLLTTTGRKSGKRRVTPLQYEEIDGRFYIGSARGTKADWYRNIVANNEVQVRVKSRRFVGIAEPVSDPKRVADFLEIRLQRNPRMVGAIMHKFGGAKHSTRTELEAYASDRAMVIIQPLTEDVS